MSESGDFELVVVVVLTCLPWLLAPVAWIRASCSVMLTACRCSHVRGSIVDQFGRTVGFYGHKPLDTTYSTERLAESTSQARSLASARSSSQTLAALCQLTASGQNASSLIPCVWRLAPEVLSLAALDRSSKHLQ